MSLFSNLHDKEYQILLPCRLALLTRRIAPPPPPPPKKLTPLKLIVLCDEKKTAMDTGSFFVNANYTTALNADVLTKEMIEQLDVDVLVVGKSRSDYDRLKLYLIQIILIITCRHGHARDVRVECGGNDRQLS